VKTWIRGIDQSRGMGVEIPMADDDELLDFVLKVK
jgi:hypothetical protein